MSLAEQINSLTRNHIRYRLFRIRDDSTLDDISTEIKNIFTPQLEEKKLNWKSFTHHWDIGVTDPFKVITAFEWVSAGGSIDINGHCNPTAFTKQE